MKTMSHMVTDSKEWTCIRISYIGHGIYSECNIMWYIHMTCNMNIHQTRSRSDRDSGLWVLVFRNGHMTLYMKTMSHTSTDTQEWIYIRISYIGHGIYSKYNIMCHIHMPCNMNCVLLMWTCIGGHNIHVCIYNVVVYNIRLHHGVFGTCRVLDIHPLHISGWVHIRLQTPTLPNPPLGIFGTRDTPPPPLLTTSQTVLRTKYKSSVLQPPLGLAHGTPQ